MEELSKSYLVGEFVKTLMADIASQPSTSFSCCPLMGYTLGRNTVVARFSGLIGIQNLPEFQEVCRQLSTGTAVKIILDLEYATLSKAALGALVAFAAACFGLQKRLYLYKTSKEVRQTIADDELAVFFVYLEAPEDVIATLKV